MLMKISAIFLVIFFNYAGCANEQLFENYTVEDGLGNNEVSVVYADGEGRILAGTACGLSHKEIRDEKFPILRFHLVELVNRLAQNSVDVGQILNQFWEQDKFKFYSCLSRISSRKCLLQRRSLCRNMSGNY